MIRTAQRLKAALGPLIVLSLIFQPLQPVFSYPVVSLANTVNASSPVKPAVKVVRDDSSSLPDLNAWDAVPPTPMPPPLPIPSPDTSPATSQKLAFVRYGIIYLSNVDGSGQHPIAQGTGPAWSPDGTRIAYSCPEPRQDGTFSFGLCMMSPDGSNKQIITTPDIGLNDSSPSWSPDGLKLAFSAGYRIASTGYSYSGLGVINADGTFRQQWNYEVGGADRSVGPPVWLDNQRLVFGGSDYYGSDL